MNNPTLYGQVKRKLNITWEDEDTTARIEEIIESAIPDMLHKLGITDSEYDFSISGAENLLFLAYCFYEWNHCLNEFETNYASMIAQVRQRHEVNFYLANGGLEDAEE